jgi:hypothetical protein
MRGIELQRVGTSVSRPRSIKRRSRLTTAVALAGLSLLCSVGMQVAGREMVGAVAATGDTGFAQPFAGEPQYEHLGPTEVTRRGQLNRPIRQRVADEIAKQLGLSKADAFTRKQYVEFVSGRGVGGSPADARVVDESARIFTNTVGRPLVSSVNGHKTRSVLASFGLFVNKSGLLESLANLDAPTRQANAIIAPGGYLGTWCQANGCAASLEALYESAYTVEAVSGDESQQVSGVAQLVTNTKSGVSAVVGMSMVPSIWLVNFALLYILNPAVAAKMPAYWAPIPSSVADAILASPTGQVPYSEYAAALTFTK